MLQETSRNKRKVPDSNYIAPVYNRSISHQHTNSLPVDTCPIPEASHGTLSGSSHNLTEQYHTPSKAYEQFVSPNHHQNYGYPVQSVKNEPYQPITNKALNKFHQNTSHHVKTFSLPVDMEPNCNNFNSFKAHVTTPGELPLPEGWSSAKTPTGQIYFINHVSQTTTWDDPRKVLNVPSNQNEINNDLRAWISRTIPMPTGWSENKSANGEIYYIDHNKQTTQWEDPRLEIYMQQDQMKSSSYQSQYKDYACYSSSTSSLSSSISSSSSIQSLNMTPSSYNQQSSQILSNSTNHQENKYQSFPIKSEKLPVKCEPTSTKSNKDIIRNLQQNLNQVLKQKNGILKKLDSLSQEENNLKSKLTQNDLDDVLNMLKNRDAKMHSFNRYDQAKQNMKSNGEDSVPDMDSTLVVGEK